MPSIEDLVIGESCDELEVSGVEEHRQVVFHMLRQATRTVDIVSRHLDRRLVDQRDLIDALRALATRNKRARIRLLVVDTGPLIRGEHRLVTLVKRLPTFFEIRGPGPDYRAFNSSFVIADGKASLYLQQAEQYTGEACFYDPVRAGELGRQFQKMWDSGLQDVNLRQMRI